jgi:hypothetical protein
MEEEQAGFNEVLETMPVAERDAFLAWWKALPSKPLQTAANGFGWQAMIARGWRACARKNVDRVAALRELETENTTLRHQHAAALAKIKKLEDFCDELKEK